MPPTQSLFVAIMPLLMLLFAGGIGPSYVFAQQVDTTDIQLEDPPGQPDQPEQPQETPPPGDEQADNEPVNFSATDSLVFSMGEHREARLYGDAQLNHVRGELTAGRVTLNISENIMSAEAQDEDDEAGEPVLRRGQDEVRSQRIRYNYITDRGKFNVARVGIDRGNLTGDEVKRTDSRTSFVQDGRYSTCELDHPHYYIEADRMKVVDEDEVFFTNAQLHILDIPYPVIFPFGYVPSRMDRRQSGLLEPTYAFQDQERRGLGLQNLGWFQYFNDHLAGRISMDVFTSGTFFIDSRLDYHVRDHYQGNIQLGYSQDRGLEQTDPDFSVNTQRQLQVSHSQDLTPYSRFSTNINLRTQDYHVRNSYDVRDRASTTTTSRLSYNYNQPEGRYNVGISSRLTQNFSDNSVSMTGPNLDFSLQRFNPFERDAAVGGQRWYETLTVRYRSSLETRYDFTPRQDPADPHLQPHDISFFDALLDPSAHEEATGDDRHINAGLRHEVRMNTQFLTGEFVNLTGNARVNEFWYPEHIQRSYNPAEQRVEREIVRGFATARDFNTGFSLNSTIYGVSNAQIGNFEGFRHTFRPSISFNYQPDFSDDIWGYFEEVQVDEEGNTDRFSRFEGSVIGGPSRGERQNISFSLNNVFETRHVTRDTTGERTTNTLRIFDRFNLSTGYNLADDQFPLNDLSFNASSSVFPNLNLNIRARFGFYALDEDGRRMTDFVWQESNRPARLDQFTFRAQTEFQGGDNGEPEFTQSQAHFPEQYDPLDQSPFMMQDPAFRSQNVQRLHAPWSVGINVNYQTRRSGEGGTLEHSAEVNLNNLRLQLTPEWQFATSFGYDFIQDDMTPSRFRFTRNLHCWNLSFEWNPFGDFQFYLFRLTVNDSQIQSLFQKLPGLNNLERSSSPINRRGADSFDF